MKRQIQVSKEKTHILCVYYYKKYTKEGTKTEKHKQLQ
jgi:hypothetical protein